MPDAPVPSASTPAPASGTDVPGAPAPGASAPSDPAPELLIVAGALTDNLAEPRLLLAARRTAPAWARGLWEFAGGKVEAGETVEQGLRRELLEELGVEVILGDELPGPDTSAVTGDAVWEIRRPGEVPAPGVEPSPLRFVMRIFWCQLAPGSADPEPLEDHDALQWLEPGSWREAVQWLPADRRVVDALLDDAIARHRRGSC